MSEQINSKSYICIDGISCSEMNNQPKYKNFISEIPTTAVEIYEMLPEGTRCEVIFNELIMSPSPSKKHQLLLVRLTGLLFNFLEANPIATLLSAPFDVHFNDEISVVQPDLFVVLNEDEHIVHDNGVFGVPSVIIEIISTNHTHDTKRKKTLYEKVGVREYFLIDPKTKNIKLLTLNSSGLYEQTYEAAGIFNSKILDCKINL